MFQPLTTMFVGTLSLRGHVPSTEEYQMDRNDGLMRGSREQRIAEMRSVGDADWNPDILLYLHIGLLDKVHISYAGDGLKYVTNSGGGYAGVANAHASTYGRRSVAASGLFNGLAPICFPVGVIILVTIWRRKR
jgi:hypothetical protein